MKYIEYLNSLIRKKVSIEKKIVIFGQNISTGSCLSGLTRNLKVQNGLIINTPNCENSLVGLGFGLMLSKTPSIFFMKQQDFLLLGIDHLVNSYNFIRISKQLSSFTIFSIVIDNGYQGMQSSLNNFADFCSMARIDGYTITNNIDGRIIINKHLISPGFRIIAVSQRLFNQDVLRPNKIFSDSQGSFFQYSNGKDFTIICFNFSLQYGFKLENFASKAGINSSLFSVNKLTPINWGKIIDNVKKTRKVIIIDDSKSANSPVDNLSASLLENNMLLKKIVIKKKYSPQWYKPNADILSVNYPKIIKKIMS